MEKVFEIYIRTTPERLWEAIVDPEIRAKYNFGAAMVVAGAEARRALRDDRPKAGGHPRRGRDPRGRPAPPLVHTMAGVLQRRGEGRGDVSRVTWEIEPVGDSCRLTAHPRPAPRGRQRPALRRVAHGPVGPQDVARVGRAAHHAGIAHVGLRATDPARPGWCARRPGSGPRAGSGTAMCSSLRRRTPTEGRVVMADSEVLRAPHVLEYPYVRSMGPVHRRLPHRAARRADPRGHRAPPGGHGDRAPDRVRPRSPPRTSASWSRWASPAWSTTWSWASTPKKDQPLDRPFAWALVQLDGRRHGHAPRRRRRLARRHVERHARHGAAGARRRSGWGACRTSSASSPRGRAVSDGTVTDGARRTRPRHHPRHADAPRLPVHRRPVPVALPPGHRPGQVHRPALPEVPQGLRPAARVVPDRRGRHHRPGRARATPGTVTTYCVVNVPFQGQSIEIPYICAQILLDGANIAFMGLIQEMPADRGPHGHAGRGGVGRPKDQLGPRPWRRSSTSGPTASPTPTTRPSRSTCERPAAARRRCDPSAWCRSPSRSRCGARTTATRSRCSCRW